MAIQKILVACNFTRLDQKAIEFGEKVNLLEILSSDTSEPNLNPKIIFFRKSHVGKILFLRRDNCIFEA